MSDHIKIMVTVETGLVGSSRTETFTYPRDDWQELDEDSRGQVVAEFEDEARDRFVQVRTTIEE